MPPASSDSDSLSLTPSPKETDSKEKLHRDNIKTIRFKAAIEDTIKDLETKKLEEEATKLARGGKWSPSWSMTSKKVRATNMDYSFCCTVTTDYRVIFP